MKAHLQRRLPGLATATMVALVAATAPAQQPTPPGPPATQWQGQGLKIEVTPMLIEPATAFFLNRGFPLAEARRIAETGCVFRSAIGQAGEDGGKPVQTDLTDWRIGVGGEWRAYKTKEDWLFSFAGKSIPETALIAFRWALFPTKQSFGPADYSWGIHAFGLPAGTPFDLRVVWWQGAARREKVLAGLACSK